MIEKLVFNLTCIFRTGREKASDLSSDLKQRQSF